MRVLAVAGVALAALVALVLLLWLFLPTLIAPAHAAPQGPAATASLAGAFRPGPGDTVDVRLSAGVASALLENAVPTGGAGPVSAAAVAFAPGRITLELFGNLPAALPVPGWSGRAFEVDLTMAPAVPQPGTVDLRLVRCSIGRLPLTDVVKPASLLRWLLRRVPPGAVPSGMRVAGSTVAVHVADLSVPTAGAGQLSVSVTPERIGVADGVLLAATVVSGTWSADAAQLQALLAQDASAGAGPSMPSLSLAGGALDLRLPAGGGRATYRLVPSVPQAGLLDVNVSGGPSAQAGPTAVAGLVARAVGGIPPWLSVTPNGVDVNFYAVPAIAVSPFGALRVIPRSVVIAGGSLRATFAVDLRSTAAG